MSDQPTKTIDATKLEGERLKAVTEALKRGGLPEDLIMRTKAVPGEPFNHREAFANLQDADRVTLRAAFKEHADFPYKEFDRKWIERKADAGR